APGAVCDQMLVLPAIELLRLEQLEPGLLAVRPRGLDVVARFWRAPGDDVLGLEGLKLDGISAGFRGDVNHLYGEAKVAVMVHTRLRDDEHRLAMGDAAARDRDAGRPDLISRQ